MKIPVQSVYLFKCVFIYIVDARANEQDQGPVGDEIAAPKSLPSKRNNN